LVFDKWKVVRENETITFKKLEKIVIDDSEPKETELKEDEFLKQLFDIDVACIGLEHNISEIINSRIAEAESCIDNESPLASILLIGSIMEGILLGTALMYPQKYNQALSAPKDKETDKVRKLREWTLNNFIDVSAEIGLLNQDVKKFSHVVRDFRNYIHPYEQMSTRFYPDKHTALICWQMLKAAINQIGTYRKKDIGGTF
jgi:hypothetical protein